jgi:hypothetical protein
LDLLKYNTFILLPLLDFTRDDEKNKNEKHHQKMLIFPADGISISCNIWNRAIKRPPMKE